MKMNLKENNLDWLRLLFAFQVLLIHGLEDLMSASSSPFASLLHHFPGVPAFFFVSGFLIYASFDKNPRINGYAKNRFFRLWPGLVFVTLGGLSVVLYAHAKLGYLDINLDTYFIWFLSQISVGQAWNPGDFSNVGLGVINGALWTITVEIIFYISVPIIYWLEKKFDGVVISLFFLSFFFYCFGDKIFQDITFAGKKLFDYFSLTPVVWGWMFLLGTLAYKHMAKIEQYFKYLYLAFPIILFLIYLDIDSSLLFASSGNRLGIFYFCAYGALILIASFRTPFIKLNHDISYGLYVWHMVVINLLIVLEIRNIFLMILVTFLISVLSWILIERPMLKRKKFSLRNVT